MKKLYNKGGENVTMNKKNYFNVNYYLKGPYKKTVFVGWKKYLDQFFWARRFYAKLVNKYQKKGRILEIGCGFGNLLALLENNHYATGIDISAEAIKIAKKNCSSSKLIKMSAEKINVFPKQSFDLIISCHTLEHINNPELVVKIISKIIKKKAYFILVVPNTQSIGKKLKGANWIGYKDKTHVSLYSPTTWINHLKNNGFRIKKTFSDGLWDTPYFDIIPKLIQKMIFYPPIIIQTIFATPLIPVKYGESLIIIARKE